MLLFYIKILGKKRNKNYFTNENRMTISSINSNQNLYLCYLDKIRDVIFKMLFSKFNKVEVLLIK